MSFTKAYLHRPPFGTYSVLATLLLMTLSALSLSAQTAAPLRGVVADEQGAFIAGARVTLTAANGASQTVMTGADGEFVLPNVAPGVYTLAAEFEGFQPHVIGNLRLPSNEQPLKIALKVAAVSIETEIKAEGAGISVEPDQNLNAVVLGGDFIETLPDNEDELRDMLESLAGPGAAGASGGQAGAQFYVDGFSGGRLPPKEAILSIRINQNPFSAEYARPGAGRVEIITKPGNNDWRGSFSFSLLNSALNARNAFALVKPDLEQKRYAFTLSGPLIRKKLSFFLNVERRGLEGFGTARAQTLDGPFVANVRSPNDSRSVNFRTDYLLNQKNTLTVSYFNHATSAENREFSARNNGVSSFILPERGTDSAITNRTFRVGEVFLINPNLIHETRLQAQLERRDFTAHTAGRAINVLDAFQGGGATCCPSNVRETNVEWQDYLTYSRKKHTIKGGVQLSYSGLRDYNATNFNGTYTFSSLDQYRAVLGGARVDPNNPDSAPVTPTQFTMNQGDPLVRYGMVQASWFAQDDVRLSQALTLSFGLRHEFQTQLQDKINFAPRVGVAWSPFKDRKTVVRAGAGIFYDRLTGSIYGYALRYDGARTQSIVIRNPEWPDPFAGTPVVDPARTVRRRLDPNLKAPYVIDINASVERQLPAGWSGSAGYMWTRGVHQFRARNINAPLPDTGLRPDPTQGNIYQTESSAGSNHNRLSFRLDRRFSRRFSIFSSYTLSWTRSDADSPFALPADNYNLRAEWGRAFTDRRHALFVGGNVMLPQRIRLTPYINFASGLPFNITTGVDENRDTVINDRPLNIGRNADLSASVYSQLPDRCLTGCKSGGQPVTLRDFFQTNFPNGVRAEGPSQLNVNLSLGRTFGFGGERNRAKPTDSPDGGKVKMNGRGNGGGKMKPGKNKFGDSQESSRFNVTLSAQVTNILNHVNFGQFSGVLTSPFFSRASSAAAPRQIEVNLRFSF